MELKEEYEDLNNRIKIRSMGITQFWDWVGVSLHAYWSYWREIFDGRYRQSGNSLHRKKAFQKFLPLFLEVRFYTLAPPNDVSNDWEGYFERLDPTRPPNESNSNYRFASYYLSLNRYQWFAKSKLDKFRQFFRE